VLLAHFPYVEKLRAGLRDHHAVYLCIPTQILFVCLFVCKEGYWHCGHSWPIVPASGDSEDDCGEADGM
jgi:hypothetical protein